MARKLTNELFLLHKEKDFWKNMCAEMNINVVNEYERSVNFSFIDRLNPGW